MREAVADPWYEWPQARAVLDARDVAGVFRLLRRVGLSQREIGARTGQSQSEVSEILRGRQVLNVTVLERVCDGLEVPRGYMRLAGCAECGVGAYAGGGADVPEEVAEEMRRRVLLAAGITVVGQSVSSLSGLPVLPGPAPVPLPSRVDGIHVAQVRNLTRRLGEAGNPACAHPEVISAAVGWAARLLGVPGVEPVKRALLVAVAELHIEAGWAGFDAGRSDRALHHFTAALVLAAEAGDTYLQATALNYAGLAISEHGRPNDGLKMLQLALFTARGIPRDEQRAVVVGEPGRAGVEAQVQANAASALADLGDLDGAARKMATAQELWLPTRADPYGDLDTAAALLALRQERLDVAEPLAAASVRRWEQISPVRHARSGIVLATVHVRAGEPGGLPLAHGAISAVSKLSSVRVRRKLEPLAVSLEARPGRDARDLARMARQSVTARA
ncbi:MAG: helix-turn-helix domain-containing protein [Pseudonocardiaceae bacterium]